METTARSLERRALCLRSIIDLTRRALECLENGDLDGLEAFRRRRAGVFSVIEKLDAEMGDVAGAPRGLLEEQSRLVAALAVLDDALGRGISLKKSEIVYNLQKLSEGRRVLSAYKSGTDRAENAEDTGEINKKA